MKLRRFFGDQHRHASAYDHGVSRYFENCLFTFFFYDCLLVKQIDFWDRVSFLHAMFDKLILLQVWEFLREVIERFSVFSRDFGSLLRDVGIFAVVEVCGLSFFTLHRSGRQPCRHQSSCRFLLLLAAIVCVIKYCFATGIWKARSIPNFDTFVAALVFVSNVVDCACHWMPLKSGFR